MEIVKDRVPLDAIKMCAESAAAPRDGVAALASSGCGVIPVVTERPPRADACLLSVPVRGDLRRFARIASASAVPVIFDDEIVDPYQVHEARAYGADCLVLDASRLDINRLAGLHDRILSLGMTPLTRVRDRLGAEAAARIESRVVLIEHPQLIDVLPPAALVVCVTRCETPCELFRWAACGADAVIAPVSGDAEVRRLVTAGRHPACPCR